MSDDLSFITATVIRIEEKLDDNIKDHENRISTIEGAHLGMKWRVTTFIAAAAVLVALGAWIIG